MTKWIYRIFIGLILVVLTLKLANWTVKRGHSLPPLPSPNGYELVLSAANSIKSLPKDLAGLMPVEIQQFAEQNRSVVESVRQALLVESAVPIGLTEAWDAQNLENMARMKQLALIIEMEAQSGLLAGRTNDAARCDLEVIQLGQTIQRGGLLINGLVSLAVETVGQAALVGKISELDATTCKEAARALEEINLRREAPETTLATERAWVAKRFGLVGMVMKFMGRKETDKSDVKFIGRAHEVGDKSNRLMVRLATRAFELEKQRLPASPAELVPDYLKAIPSSGKSKL